jgi:phosphopantothenoylcysteine decarboxylase/phosphopantothenate--cysteine ligase
MPCPYGVSLSSVETGAEMREAVLAACDGADAVIMAAAVADYRPLELGPRKVKKGPKRMSVEMEKTPDFLLEVTGSIVKVGFAAETNDLLDNARKKLTEKGLDLIAANDLTAPGAGFAVDTNQITIIDTSGAAEEVPLLPKYDVSHRLLDRVVTLLRERT